MSPSDLICRMVSMEVWNAVAKIVMMSTLMAAATISSTRVKPDRAAGWPRNAVDRIMSLSSQARVAGGLEKPKFHSGRERNRVSPYCWLVFVRLFLVNTSETPAR